MGRGEKLVASDAANLGIVTSEVQPGFRPDLNEIKAVFLQAQTKRIGHEKHKEARKKGKTANRGLTPPTRLDCGIISTQVIRYLPSLPRRASWRMLARFPFTRLPSFRSINTLLDAGALVVINSIFPS